MSVSKVRALLVHGEGEPLGSLNKALHGLKVDADHADTCKEALRFLRRATEAPDVVFTDTALPDGSWRELLDAARYLRVPAKIIVVSRTEDPWLYLEAMESGAFDFMIPPFTTADVEYILRYATGGRLAHAAGTA